MSDTLSTEQITNIIEFLEHVKTYPGLFFGRSWCDHNTAAISIYLRGFTHCLSTLGVPVDTVENLILIERGYLSAIPERSMEAAGLNKEQITDEFISISIEALKRIRDNPSN